MLRDLVIPTFLKTKYLSSHIGVHIDKLAFGIKDFYFESKFDNSRWHWEALGPQPIFVPRGWSTSGKNFSSMLSSALPYSGLFLDLWLVIKHKVVSFLTSQNSGNREGEKPETDRDGQTKIFLWQRILAVRDCLCWYSQHIGWNFQVKNRNICHDKLFQERSFFHVLMLATYCWQIFVRLFYVEESESLMSQMSSQTTSLRQKLISLRQDEVGDLLEIFAKLWFYLP